MAVANTSEAQEMVGLQVLSGLQKSAMLLILLGEEASAEVMREMDEDEVQVLSRAIARSPVISSDQGEAILDEFYQLSLAQDYMLKGGLDYARKLLVSAFGPDQGRRLLDRLMKTLGADAANFDALRKADPQQLAKFIHSEHPQTIALILSHLNPSQAAGLLGSLPPELRSDVSVRMANLDQISPEIIAKIAQVVGAKLKSLGEVSREAYGGVRAVAEMFNRLDSGTSKDVLEGVENDHPSLGQSIRMLMFVFDDLLKLDGAAMKELSSRIDRKLLTVALKGTSDAMKNHFTGSMSQRGAEMLREDIESLGPTRIRDVEAAQQQIISLVRQLEAEGVLSVKGAEGDSYVV